MGPDMPWDSFGLCFGPNGRFWTHFGPNLMLLEGTGTVVNEDWTWAEAWANLGLWPTLDDLGLSLGPLLDQPWADFGNMFLRHREYVVETEQMSSVETRQTSQQQSSVLSQQQTSVLFQRKTSILSQQKTRQLPAPSQQKTVRKH